MKKTFAAVLAVLLMMTMMADAGDASLQAITYAVQKPVLEFYAKAKSEGRLDAMSAPLKNITSEGNKTLCFTSNEPIQVGHGVALVPSILIADDNLRLTMMWSFYGKETGWKWTEATKVSVLLDDERSTWVAAGGADKLGNDRLSVLVPVTSFPALLKVETVHIKIGGREFMVPAADVPVFRSMIFQWASRSGGL